MDSFGSDLTPTIYLYEIPYYTCTFSTSHFILHTEQALNAHKIFYLYNVYGVEYVFKGKKNYVACHKAHRTAACAINCQCVCKVVVFCD